MESEVICADAKLNKLQFDQIKESQKEMQNNQNEHNTRLRILEENKIQMTSEFANLKQSQSEQKVLMLDLDRISREDSTKQFEKNEKKFQKINEGQDAILEKLNEVQDNNINKTEISKSKMIMYAAIIVALITALPYIIDVFVK